MILWYLSLAGLIAIAYPYFIYPLVLQLLPKQSIRTTSKREETGQRVALLFCAHNEQASLPAKLQNLKAIKKLHPDLEICVYADACSDASVQILLEAGEILKLQVGSVRVGKATGMRTLVDSADADILVFTDANVIVDPESIARLVSYFGDPQIGTVAGTLRYTNPEESQTARTGSAYWRLEERIKRLESETGSTMGADGSLFAMRRSLYPTVPANLLDDMISSIAPLFSGFRVISAPDVHAYEAATVHSGDELRRKRRIACRAFNTHRYLRTQIRSMITLNRFKYFSHKYIRWFSAVFLMAWVVVTLSAIAIHVGVSYAISVAVLGALSWAAGRVFDIPVVSSLTEITLSIVATGFGVIEAIAGRTYQTWVPARGR